MIQILGTTGLELPLRITKNALRLPIQVNYKEELLI